MRPSRRARGAGLDREAESAVVEGDRAVQIWHAQVQVQVQVLQAPPAARFTVAFVPVTTPLPSRPNVIPARAMWSVNAFRSAGTL